MENKQTSEDVDIEIYNDEQKFYVNVSDNCTAMIEQHENSIKLQKDIKEMADGKVIALAD